MVMFVCDEAHKFKNLKEWSLQFSSYLNTLNQGLY